MHINWDKPHITESLGLEGTSEDHPIKPLDQAGSPGADDRGTFLGGFGMSLERKTPHPPCSRALPLPMLRWKLLCFSLAPLLLFLELGTTKKSLEPSSGYYSGAFE